MGKLTEHDEFRWSAYLTDKNDTGHGYGSVYDNHLLESRLEVKTFLEIGSRLGSVKLWLDYFPNAVVHCVEKHKFDFEHERFVFNQIDQADADAQVELAKKVGGFDVIVDDGPHTSPEQLTSISCLMGYVNDGGYYIIEDLHTTDDDGDDSHNYKSFMKDSDISVNDLLREYKDGIYKNYKYINNSEDLRKMGLEIFIDRAKNIRWSGMRYPSEIAFIKKSTTTF